MTKLSQLSHALQDHYRRDPAEIRLSSNMESEIALNSLVLDSSQLRSAEIPCLTRFLSGKEVSAPSAGTTHCYFMISPYYGASSL
jgi:hypothetical protein